MYKRNTFIGINVTERQHRYIKEKAQDANLTMTDFILRCCYDKPILATNELKEVRRQLYGIGTNLNQLTTLANMGRIGAVHLDKTLAELRACHEALDTVRDLVRKS